MAEYRPGQSVKVDGETYKVGDPAAGYMCTSSYGYETFLTTGQLDAGKRTVIPGGPVDVSQIDVAALSSSERNSLLSRIKNAEDDAKIKPGTPEFAAAKAAAKAKAGL